MDYSQYKQFEFRRKFWKLFGAQINIFDPLSQQQIGFIKMKAFKLKEDIRIYRDPGMQQELLRIQARNVIDFGATYDVIDSTSSQTLFSYRRKGLRSTFVRDHWLLLDPAGNQVGEIQETSSQLAIMRRWFGIIPYVGDLIELIFAFVPQTYSFYQNDQTGQPKVGATVVHRKNPFIVKMGVDMTNPEINMDHRVVFAGSALLAINDAAKNS